MDGSSGASLVQLLDQRTFLIKFDTRVYSSTAVKKAAYKFSRQFAVIFSLVEEHWIEARLSFLGDGLDCEEVIQAFCAEVLDQDLREQIKSETEATRNLILAQAFSKTSLLQED